MTITQALKKELWKRFGDARHPAEWDGKIYGGGKLSQRFWEYFKVIELLNLKPDSVVLDIGGGSPTGGAGFFASLLSTVGTKVVVMDSNVPCNVQVPTNIQLLKQDANYDGMKRLLGQRTDITHVSCVSVFEHVTPVIREGMMRAVNEAFRGECMAVTFEYHAKRTFFDSQLTARSVSALFSVLDNFYLDEMVASPVWCENAFSTVGGGMIDGICHMNSTEVPCWYPVAARFLPA